MKTFNILSKKDVALPAALTNLTLFLLSRVTARCTRGPCHAHEIQCCLGETVPLQSITQSSEVKCFPCLTFPLLTPLYTPFNYCKRITSCWYQSHSPPKKKHSNGESLPLISIVQTALPSSETLHEYQQLNPTLCCGLSPCEGMRSQILISCLLLFPWAAVAFSLLLP